MCGDIICSGMGFWRVGAPRFLQLLRFRNRGSYQIAWQLLDGTFEGSKKGLGIRFRKPYITPRTAAIPTFAVTSRQLFFLLSSKENNSLTTIRSRKKVAQSR